MADRKISDLTALTAQASGDLLPIVDVSEAAAADKNKSITIQELFRGIPVSVGVGTTSPGAPLAIATASDTTNLGATGLTIGGASTLTSGDVLMLNFTPIGADSNRARAGIGCVVGSDWGKGNLTFYTLDASSGVAMTTAAERMRIDSSGRVGIGTSSPSAKLTIHSAASTEEGLRVQQITADRTSGAALALVYDDRSGSTSPALKVIQNGTGDIFQLYDGGTARFIVKDGGNVGIGTTSPGGVLQVREGTDANLIFDADGTETAIQAFNDAGSAVAPLRLRASEIKLITSSTERARIDSSGRLLVGTTISRGNFYNTSSQDPKVQIEGTSYVTSAISNVTNSNDTFGARHVFAKSRGTTVGSNTIVQNGDECGGLIFQGSDGSEFVDACRISGQVDGTPGANDMPGRLVFSTTADGASSPTERMRLVSNGQIFHFVTAGNGITTVSDQGAGQSSILYIGRHSGTSTVNGTLCYLVWTNGNVENTNNSYGGISDIKLKENIVDAGSQWDDLKAIQVRKYNFKEETGHQTHTQLGVIAQEVELISPGLVNEAPDRDAEGNDLGTTTKSVNYSVLYMKAVKALQEAMERIETLEAKVSALEAN